MLWALGRSQVIDFYGFLTSKFHANSIYWQTQVFFMYINHVWTSETHIMYQCHCIAYTCCYIADKSDLFPMTICYKINCRVAIQTYISTVWRLQIARLLSHAIDLALILSKIVPYSGWFIVLRGHKSKNMYTWGVWVSKYYLDNNSIFLHTVSWRTAGWFVIWYFEAWTKW